jgi:mono/diheme cytochrome c family protein
VKDAKTTQAILALAIVVLLVFFGCKENQIDYPSRQMPAGLMEDALQISSGHELFRDKCASCHGKPSEGRSDRAAFFQPPAPDFFDAHYRDLDPAYLYWRIESGKTIEPFRSQGSVMPAWGVHFSAEQIWQIVAYLQTRAH